MGQGAGGLVERELAVAQLLQDRTALGVALVTVLCRCRGRSARGIGVVVVLDLDTLRAARAAAGAGRRRASRPAGLPDGAGLCVGFFQVGHYLLDCCSPLSSCLLPGWLTRPLGSRFRATLRR